LSYSLRARPDPHFINWQQDPQSNFLARLVFPEKTGLFEVEVDLVAEMSVLNPFDFFLEPEAEHFPFKYDRALDHELAPFLLKAAPTPSFANYVGNLRRDNQQPQEKVKNGDAHPRTMDFLVGINQRLWRDISYLIRMQPG